VFHRHSADGDIEKLTLELIARNCVGSQVALLLLDQFNSVVTKCVAVHRKFLLERKYVGGFVGGCILAEEIIVAAPRFARSVFQYEATKWHLGVKGRSTIDEERHHWHSRCGVL
jgi:hypothetical protein